MCAFRRLFIAPCGAVHEPVPCPGRGQCRKVSITVGCGLGMFCQQGQQDGGSGSRPATYTGRPIDGYLAEPILQGYGLPVAQAAPQPGPALHPGAQRILPAGYPDAWSVGSLRGVGHSIFLIFLNVIAKTKSSNRNVNSQPRIQSGPVGQSSRDGKVISMPSMGASAGR